MPVENPDGSTGIALHVDDSPPLGGRVDRTVVFEGDNEVELFRSLYSDRWLGNRSCVYYQATFVVIHEGALAGKGASGGKASIADGTLRQEDRQASIRVMILTHELLHNVVWRLPEEGAVEGDWAHSTEGWLSPSLDFRGENQQYLSKPAVKKLSEQGCAHNEEFGGYFCGSR